MDNKRDIYTKYMVDNDREYRVDHNQERVDNDRDRVDITGIGWTMTGIYIGWTTTGFSCTEIAESNFLTYCFRA